MPLVKADPTDLGVARRKAVQAIANIVLRSTPENAGLTRQVYSLLREAAEAAAHDDPCREIAGATLDGAATIIEYLSRQEGVPEAARLRYLFVALSHAQGLLNTRTVKAVANYDKVVVGIQKLFVDLTAEEVAA